MTTTHSQVIDAINVRISTRHFNSDLIEEGIVRQLKQNMDAMSLISDVRFTLLENHPELFADGSDGDGFPGAAHLIVLSGANNAQTMKKAGFYGERLVLTSVLLGLASCWVDENVDLQRAADLARIPSDETVFAGIAIGYFPDQKELLEKSYEERAQFQASHRVSKSLEELGGVSGSSPQWYANAISAVTKAPSPSNAQPIRFALSTDNKTVESFISPDCSLNAVRTQLCLGIAQLHVQIGASADPDNAASGQWTWGEKDVFTVR